MDSITRKDIDRICQLLQNHINTEESIRLAKILTDADIIPKLYQRNYIESLHTKFSEYDSLKEYMADDMICDNGYVFRCIVADNTIKTESEFQLVKDLAEKAHERQDDICDYDDSILPGNIFGRCQEENHRENCESNVTLTDEEQKEFDKICKEISLDVAWDEFEDKINPDNQKLSLILDWGSDESKVSKDSGIYICKVCLDILRDNSDGGISCDMEAS